MTSFISITHRASIILFLTTGMLSAQNQNGGPAYRGYRLHLTHFEILNSDKSLLKIRFDAANTGRYDVDLSNPDHIRWTQFLFEAPAADSTVFSLRNNIREALAGKSISIKAGKVKRALVVRIRRQPIPDATAVPPATITEDHPATPVLTTQEETSENGSSKSPPYADAADIPTTEDSCPDIAFTHLSIIEEQDDRATLNYTLVNSGQRDFFIVGNNDQLIIRAFISGVTKWTRGALPVDTFVFDENYTGKNLLHPGESLSGSVQFDVRRKTRYMKCLILLLDSEQYVHECDRTNNTAAVVLK